MKRFLQSLVCLLTALHLVGGHWGVLQMVAWARMLNEYTAERGLITGVMETFDGEHGCAMCRKIADGRQKEQKENLPLTKSGQENLAKWFGMSPTRVLPEPPWSEDLAVACHAAPQSHPSQWDAEPPVPPPERMA